MALQSFTSPLKRKKQCDIYCYINMFNQTEFTKLQILVYPYQISQILAIYFLKNQQWIQALEMNRHQQISCRYLLLPSPYTASLTRDIVY